MKGVDNRSIRPSVLSLLLFPFHTEGIQPPCTESHVFSAVQSFEPRSVCIHHTLTAMYGWLSVVEQATGLPPEYHVHTADTPPKTELVSCMKPTLWNPSHAFFLGWVEGWYWGTLRTKFVDEYLVRPSSLQPSQPAPVADGHRTCRTQPYPTPRNPTGPRTNSQGRSGSRLWTISLRAVPSNCLPTLPPTLFRC